MVAANILFHAEEDAEEQERHRSHPGSQDEEMAGQGHESPVLYTLGNKGVIFLPYADLYKTNPFWSICPVWHHNIVNGSPLFPTVCLV